MSKEIWAILGQSNALGRQASPTSPTVGPPYASVPYWTFAGGLTQEPTQPVDLDYLAAPQWIGAEIDIAAALLADSRDIAIVKWARGSTGLAQHWLPGTATGYLSDCVASIRRFMRRLAFEGQESHLAGVYWNQWEEDAKSDADAAAYEANLTTLIALLRAEFHPDLPFVIARASTGVGTGGARLPSRVAAVQAGQDAVEAADPLVWLHDTDGYDLEADFTHYTPDAQQLIGQAIGSIIVSDVPVPTYAAPSVLRVSHYATQAIAQDVGRFLRKPVRSSPIGSRYAVEDATGGQWMPSTWSAA